MAKRGSGKRVAAVRILITGGGTGGHLFPAIAVAEEFRHRFPGCPILFIGSGRSMDKKVLSSRGGYDTATIHCGGLKGGTILARLKTLLLLPLGLYEAMGIVKRFKPDLVFGVGGYVTGPVLLAAKWLGVPACIHEQNSVPGLANRKLGRFVDKVFLSIPGSEKYFSASCSMLGNPVRKKFLELRKRHEFEKQNRLEQQKTAFVVTVLGGSLGAHYLNCLLPPVLADVNEKLPERGLTVIHQTGRDDLAMVRAAYKGAGLEVRVEPFFDTMAEIMGGSDLLICRAGATTIAELTALGKPAILVPYPYAADDHQRKNGQFLVNGKAALMFGQEELSQQLLVETVVNLCTDGELRGEMANAAAKLARPEAAARIVDECLQIIDNKERHV